jgi:hypothetical protein
MWFHVQFDQKILKGLCPGHLLTNWHNGAKVIILLHSIVLPPIFQIIENVTNILVRPSATIDKTISKLLTGLISSVHVGQR